MAGVRVGVAYIDVVPNMETFGAGLATGATAGIAKAAPSIKAALSSAMGNISGGLSKLKGVAMGLLGGGAIFAGLDMLAKKSVTYGQAVERIVATFGASKADATEFKAIVDATGGSADMVAKVLVRLDAQFTKLNASSGAGAANLMSYGLNADTLSVKAHGLVGVMDNLATAYANAADKQAFIASTLGPRGMNMAPVLDQWNQLRKGVEALGLDWAKVAPSKKQMMGFEVMQVGLQAIEVQIGTMVIPIVTKLGTALHGFIEDMTKGVNPLKAFWDNLIAGVGGFTGMLIKMFALIMGAKILSAVSLIGKGLFGLVKILVVDIPAAFVALEGTLATFGVPLLPFLGIIAAIVAAVAGLGFIFYKNWDSIKKGAGIAFDAIKHGISAAWKFLKPIADFIGKALGDAFHEISKAAVDLWHAIAPAFKALAGVFKPIWQAIQPLVEILGGALWLAFKVVAVYVRTVLAPAFRLYGVYIRDVFVPIVKVLIGVVKAVTWPLRELGKLIGVIGDTAAANASANLADFRAMVLSIGLAIKGGMAPADAFNNALAQMAMAGGATTEQLTALQVEANTLFANGTISAEEYTRISLALGHSAAQSAVEIARMTKASTAAAAAAAAVGKAWKAAWPQLAIGAQNMGLLAAASGQTGQALKAGLLAAIDTIKSDGGKAFGDFVQATEASMKSWAESIAASFSGATSNFDNLAKKSHQTMQYILADAVKEAKDQAQIAVDVQAIAKRAGTSSAAVLQYMADHGITSVRELNAVVNSSPAAFKAFQQAIKSSSDSVKAGSLPILNVANQQFMKLIDQSGVLDKMNSVIHLDHSQITSGGAALQAIIDMLGGVGAGRLTLGIVGSDGTVTPGGSGRPGDYAPTPSGSATSSRGTGSLFHNPHLALGGIVTQPMTVDVAEHGAEAVIPLDKLMGGGKRGPTQIVGDLHINWDEGIARMIAIAQDQVDEERGYQETAQRMARGA